MSDTATHPVPCSVRALTDDDGLLWFNADDFCMALQNGAASAAGPDQRCPYGLDAHAPGAKLDAGKPIAGELVLSFPRAMLALIDIATFGAAKYSRAGFPATPDGATRYLDAAMRHLLAHGTGEKNDKESGMPHLWHALWNIAAVVEITERDHDAHLPGL